MWHSLVNERASDKILSGIVMGSEYKNEWLGVQNPAVFSYWSIFSFSIKHLKTS